MLGHRAGGERLGLLAAGLCAVYPLMIAVDGALMSETLYGPLIAIVLLAAWRLLDHPGAWIALGTGAAIALAALTRSEALLLVPCSRGRRRARRLGLGAARRARDRLALVRAVDDPQGPSALRSSTATTRSSGDCR